MVMTPAKTAAALAALGVEQRRAALITVPEHITMADLEGLFAGYNAARGLGSNGIAVIAMTDMPVAEGGEIHFDFNFNGY